MSAGKYDQRIRLERAIRVDDGFTSAGAATWQPIATVWAEAVPVRDGEKIAAGQVIATSMYRFKVRHSSKVADLGPADRIVFKGRVYDIAGIKPGPDLNREVEITAVAEVSA